MYYASILIAITGLVTYQIAVKAAPKAVNPFWLLVVVYAIAAVACAPAAVLWRRYASPMEPGFTLNLLGPAVLLAVSVILIEIGYLLVYRSGWSLSVAPGLTQAVTLSALFLIGLLCFAEKLTLAKVAGLVLCLTGVFLLSRRG